MVTYILGSSKESIYDLIRVNQFYDLDPKEGTAFAIIQTDFDSGIYDGKQCSANGMWECYWQDIF